MTIRNILVHVELDLASEARLRYATSLAASYNAALTGVAVTLPPALAAAVMITDARRFDAILRTGEETTATAKVQFEEITKNANVEGLWRNGVGMPADVLIAEAGCADLVVLGRGNRKNIGDSVYAKVVPDDVVLTCGRPVLVLPDEWKGPFRAKRILISWKSTPEAARAAHDALPLLVRADEVILMEIASEHTESKRRPHITIEAMAGHLRAHGAPIIPRKMNASGQDVGDLLVRAASDSKCDLIVAGGYGHNRLKEWVLGGVTYSLLHSGSIPCLVAR